MAETQAQPYGMAMQPALHAWLFSVSVGTNIAGLALPLALVHVYDRILPNAALGTALALFGAVALAILAEGVLRHVRGVGLARLAAREEHRLAMAAASATLDGRLDADRAEAIFARIARAKEGLSGGLLASLYDLPFALIFIALVWALAGAAALVPIIAVLGFAAMAWLVAGPMTRSGAAMLQANDARAGLLRGLFRGTDAWRATAGHATPAGRLQEARAARAAATERQESAASILQEGTQIAGLAITIGVVAMGADMAMNGQLSSGGLGAATMLATRGGGALIGLCAALARSGTSRASAMQVRDALAHDPPAAIAPPMAPGLHLVEAASPEAADAALAARHGRGAILVPARPLPLAGSIMENLTLFDPSRQEAALALSRRLGLDAVVAKLGQGYATEIGFDGRAVLSPGATKRIALIAAILQRPALLLLERPAILLDQKGAEQLAALLRELAEDGQPIAITTDHPALLAACGKVPA
jgi:ABC-type protease/lipase transport system fused ATPase/permease subunit